MNTNVGQVAIFFAKGHKLRKKDINFIVTA